MTNFQVGDWVYVISPIDTGNWGVIAKVQITRIVSHSASTKHIVFDYKRYTNCQENIKFVYISKEAAAKVVWKSLCKAVDKMERQQAKELEILKRQMRKAYAIYIKALRGSL